MKTTGSIEIKGKIDDIFRWATEDIAYWSSIVVEDYVVDEKPGMVGTTFKSITEDRGQRMEFDGTVTENDPPRRHRATLIGKQFDIDVLYELEEVGEKVRLTQTSVVNPKGFVKAIFFLFGWAMKKSSCKALDDELQRLATYCRQQQA